MTGQAMRYVIKYSTQPVTIVDDAWWNGPGTLTVPSPPTPSIAGSTDEASIAGLAVGETYFFAVQAIDDAGNASEYSNVASAAVEGCDVPGNAPTLAAAAEDTAAVDVLLSWSGTPSPPATSLHVYRAVGTGSYSLRAALAASATSYRDNSVSAGTTYRYQVAWAVDCGDGPRSAERSITPVAPSNGPTPSTGTTASVHAYPNPSDGPVQIVVNVPEAPSPTVHVRIRLYNIAGHWVAELVDGHFAPGEHPFTWSRVGRAGQTVAPGYYEAIGSVGSTRVRERIVLLP